MGQAQINVRTRACSGTFIARTKQAALTHNVRGKELRVLTWKKNVTTPGMFQSKSINELACHTRIHYGNYSRKRQNAKQSI